MVLAASPRARSYPSLSLVPASVSLAYSLAGQDFLLTPGSPSSYSAASYVPMLKASYLKARKCTHAVRRKPQPGMVANSLISLRAAEIPGMLDRWHMRCPTISQPHNDTPPLSFCLGEQICWPAHPCKWGHYDGKKEKGRKMGGWTLKPNHFLKIMTLARPLLGPSPHKESSRNRGGDGA